MPAASTSPDPKSLQGPLLAAVSRSFYLSLRFLPPPVRSPLSVSYLLARAADTIADVAACPAADRLELLAQFRQAIALLADRPAASGTPPDPSFLAFLESAHRFASKVDHVGERELLERLGECFAQLGKMSVGSREKIRTVLGHILDGMTLDLQRFPDALRLRTLGTNEELQQYTWLVAGCVGEFWTAICAAELPGVFTRSPAEMTALGGRFGQGLQLINILRDQAGDAAIGRCYLPAASLREEGAIGEIVWPTSDWQPWHRVRQDLIGIAHQLLAEGWIYAASQRSIRLRFATLMPLLIGEGTLARLAALPPDGPPAAVKITRPEVKRHARRALWMAVTGNISKP